MHSTKPKEAAYIYFESLRSNMQLTCFSLALKQIVRLADILIGSIVVYLGGGVTGWARNLGGKETVSDIGRLTQHHTAPSSDAADTYQMAGVATLYLTSWAARAGGWPAGRLYNMEGKGSGFWCYFC